MAIKPGTRVDKLEPFADQIDMALVMTVEPGFGGQKFMEDMMPKVNKLTQRCRGDYMGAIVCLLQNKLQTSTFLSCKISKALF